jgi:hypothetical protein
LKIKIALAVLLWGTVVAGFYLYLYKNVYYVLPSPTQSIMASLVTSLVVTALLFRGVVIIWLPSYIEPKKQDIPSDITHKQSSFAGTIDGGLDGHIISYKNAKEKPKITYIKTDGNKEVLSAGERYSFIHVNFGTEKIVIGSDGKIFNYNITGLKFEVRKKGKIVHSKN